VVIYGSDLGRKYNLEAPALVVGRSSKSDVQIDQESVSRAHSKIVNSGRAIRIRDLGSTNGTYVNDELIDERTLEDGDFIQDRPHDFQVSFPAATSSAPTTKRSTGSPPSTA